MCYRSYNVQDLFIHDVSTVDLLKITFRIKCLLQFYEVFYDKRREIKTVTPPLYMSFMRKRSNEKKVPFNQENCIRGYKTRKFMKRQFCFYLKNSMDDKISIKETYEQIYFCTFLSTLISFSSIFHTSQDLYTGLLVRSSVLDVPSKRQSLIFFPTICSRNALVRDGR